MSTYNPQTSEDFKTRDQLLTLCLRPDPLPFPIKDEYPIVLSQEGRAFSYCMDYQQKLCSHANLWPRVVIDRQQRVKAQIGLVGNVATDPSMQGRGHMRELLSKLEDIAIRQNLSALVLWSDLDQFYHKLGYESVGQEFHLGFPKVDRKRPSHRSYLGTFQLNGDLKDGELEKLLALRPQLPLTLLRTPEEMRAQLTIPWLDCFRAYRNGELVAYALIGKGYDMVGVIHEWGAKDLSDLIALIDYCASTLPFESLMLLLPEGVDAVWKARLVDLTESYEKHSMALIKPLNQKQKREDLSSLFVWGLDSI